MILVRSILSITGTPNNGSLPIGNGQGFTVNTLTAGTNITITNGPGTITIDAAGGGGGTPAGSTNEIQYNNAGAFGANSNLQWDITNSRAIIGTEAVADTNSRLVVIGKGQMTNTTFAVHNSTGTNNAFIVRDDGIVLINSSTLAFAGTNNTRLQVGTNNGTTHSTDIVSSATNGGQATFLRLRNDGQTKVIQFDNGSGSVACSFQHSNSASNILQLKNLSNNVEQQFEVNDFNLSGRALLAAGNSSARLVLLRSGTISIGLYDNNFNDSFWNPTGTRTFIFGGNTRTNASALVEMTSTTRGFLPPRMTTTDINNITSPATGLTVYNTTENTICFYNGTSWQKVNHSNL